jgi:hypothetical protein
MSLLIPQTPSEIDQVRNPQAFKVKVIFQLDRVVKTFSASTTSNSSRKSPRKSINFPFFPAQNFVFSFLLSSRVFIQPHELLRKLIESVPESDESLERMVVLMQEWTRVRQTSKSDAMRKLFLNFFTFSRHTSVVSLRLSRRRNHVARQTYRRSVCGEVAIGRSDVGHV